MSRASYGADVFSPIRGSASFNDALFDEKDSDSFDLWQEPYDAIKKNGNSEVKGKTSSITFLSKVESPSKDEVPDNLQSAITSRKKDKKVSPSKNDLSSLSYVTTRSKSSHKREKMLDVIQESKSTHNATVSKARKKTYVTVRSEVDSNKELSSNKIKQKKDSALSLAISSDSNKELPHSKSKQHKGFSSSMAISADSNKDLPLSKIKKSKDSSTSSTISTDSSKEIPPMKIKKSKDSSSSSTISTDSNKEIPPIKIKKNKISSLSLTPGNSDKELLTQNKNSLVTLAEEQPEKCSTFNACGESMKSVHNNPGLSAEHIESHKILLKSNELLKKNHSKSKKLETDSNASVKKCTEVEKPEETCLDKENEDPENCNAESILPSAASKPEQIQANIIEKLVKDAVSFEFDAIRQMLYHHQLQLLKYMDHKNIYCCELQKAFEDLVEENKRLKNLIAQQKI